jgi:hypothetical protein
MTLAAFLLLWVAASCLLGPAIGLFISCGGACDE